MKIKRKSSVIIFLVVGGLLLFLHGVGILRPLENFFRFVTKPLAQRFYSWGSDSRQIYEVSQNNDDWSQKYTTLQTELARLTVANSQYQEIADENKKLRAALQFTETSNFRVVAANIIAQEEGGEDSHDFVVNRGTRDGIRVGLGVVGEEGVIVGQVIETTDVTAKICLTTSAGCQLAAAIQNQDKTQGLTDGDLGLTIKMNYIPQLEKIAPGDIVITSGLGGKIPRGLVIGKVASVQNASNEVWQTAKIEPLINFNNLTILSVIIP